MQRQLTDSIVPSAQDGTVLASLNRALHQAMAEDSRVVVIGEDILDPYGGAFKVTRGLSTRFPTRTITTPISESAIVGVGCGMAIRGLKPVVEIMFGDFVMLAADQLINSVSKYRWMFDDQVRVPLVIRTPMGGRRGYGPTHSQSLEKHLLGVPGLTVVAPHVLGDPGGLLSQAVLNSDDPVLFIENKTCYTRRCVTDIPGMSIETYIGNEAQFPTTLVQHKGSGRGPDGLLCCYGGMVPICLDAVQELRKREGLLIDLAVLAQLSPPPTDHIKRVLDQSHPPVIAYVEESSTVAGWAAELVAQVEQIRSDNPDMPPFTHRRIGGDFTPIPSSRELELRSLPQTEDIISNIVRCF